MEPMAFMVSVMLPLTGVGASVLAALLLRKGKRADENLAENKTSFDQMAQIASALREDNARLTAERDAERAARITQLGQCRDVTETLIKAVDTVRAHPERRTKVADDAHRALDQHREDTDHGGREERS